MKDRVSVVSARYTAAVFAVHRPPPEVPLVLKLHAAPAAYGGETLAYALLADTAPVARLYAEAEESLSLLLEYLPEPAGWTGAGMPAVLAERVAAVHTASLRLPGEAAEALAGFTLAAQHGAPPPSAYLTHHRYSHPPTPHRHFAKNHPNELKSVRKRVARQAAPLPPRNGTG